MNKKFSSNRKSNQQGVALLEVMIAMFLFAISVLGFSQLQLMNIKESHDSEQRATAVRIASGLISRMSANSGAADTYRTIVAGFSGCSDDPDNACADTGDLAAQCSGEQLAEYDVWYSFCGLDGGVGDSLTGFTPAISCAGGACGAGVDMDVSIQWISKIADSNADIATTNVTDQVIMSVRLSN